MRDILHDRDLALGAVALWEQYEGEADIERAIIAYGEMLHIDAVEGEGYIDTVARVCRERTGGG